jgi:hypothetical protein
MNFSELSRPLDISDIDFRVQSINNGGYATILAYKDARVDMARLDAAVGSLHWQRKHEIINGNLYCHVGIFNVAIGQWVWKCDVGTESMTEAQKGQSSDSFKRACFNWGIGRELYDYPMISIKLNDNEWTKDGGRPKQTFNLKIRDWRWYSEFTDGRLSFLAAKDENGKLRFKWGEMKPQEKEPEYKPASGEATEEPVVEVAPVVESTIEKPIEIKVNEVDEERQRAIAEYKAVFGKAPHGRMATDTMLNSIQEELMRLDKEEAEDIPEIDLTTDEELLASIKDMYETIELFKEPKSFIEWAKEIVAAFMNTESEDNIEEFKELCNAHYKKLVS